MWRECQQGAGGGSSEVTVTLPGKQSYMIGAFQCYDQIGVTWMPSGTWIVRINVTTAASSGSYFDRIDVCRLNSSGTSLETICTWTGTQECASTGIKVIEVTQAAGLSLNSSDYWYIQIHAYSNSHSGTTLGITPSTWCGDPWVIPNNYPLYGDIAGTGTFTGDLEAIRELAGTIGGVSSFVGDLVITAGQTWELQGTIAGQGTVTGLARQYVYVDDQPNKSYEYRKCRANITTDYHPASEWESASETFDIARIEFWGGRLGSPSGNIWIEIWSDDSGTPGSLISSDHVSNTVSAGGLVTVGGGGQSIIFDFPKQPRLTSANRYFFVMLGDYTVNDSNHVQIHSNNGAVSGWVRWNIRQNGDEDEDTFDALYTRIWRGPYPGTKVLSGSIAGVSTVTGDLEVFEYAHVIYEDNGDLDVGSGYGVVLDYPATVDQNDILIAMLSDEDNDDFIPEAGVYPDIAWGVNKNHCPDSIFERGAHIWQLTDITKSQSDEQSYSGDYSMKCVTGTDAYSSLYNWDVGAPGSTQYTISFYMYNTASGNTFNFYALDQDQNTIASSTNQSSTQNQWVRHSITFSTAADDTGIRLKIEKNNDTTARTFYIDAVQFEQAASASSFLASESEWKYGAKLNHASYSFTFWWKRADGDEDGGSRFFASNSDAGSVAAAVMLRFSGGITTGVPYEAQTSSGITQSTSPSISQITTLGKSRLCLSLVGVEDNRTFTGGTDYQKEFELLTTFGNDTALALYSNAVPDGGVVSQETLTIDQIEYWGTFTLALIPQSIQPLAGAIAGQSTLVGDVRFVGYPNYKGNGGIGTDTGHNLTLTYPSPVNADDILVAVVGDEDNDEWGWPRAASPNKNLCGDSSFREGIHWWETVGAPSPAKTWSTDQAYDGNQSMKVVSGTGAYAGVDHARGPIPISGSTQYTFSFYFYNTNGSVNYDFQARDQDENVIQANNNQSSTQDTWVRHTITFTTGSDDTGCFLFIRKSNDTTDVTFYLDAIQLEQAASASSYLECATSEWKRMDFEHIRPGMVLEKGRWHRDRNRHVPECDRRRHGPRWCDLQIRQLCGSGRSVRERYVGVIPPKRR
jgi:hypothetical protein